MYKNDTIHIEDKDKIYDEITKIMNNIDHGVISCDEIVINISEPNLPVFELLDLPGIISYPPENAKQTLELNKKYLENKNTIVLCVVPATTTRLTSCQSIALIKEMNMEHNTILALTMADRVQKNNIPELLISRLLKTSDELSNLNFSGYVAVVNRIHTDEYSLEENDIHEISWFKKNILDHIPIDLVKEHIVISQNITINNLVKQLDKLYSKYIEKEWKSNIIQKIKSKKEILEKIKFKLGVHINDFKFKNENFPMQLVDNIKKAYGESYNILEIIPANIYTIIINLLKQIQDNNKCCICHKSFCNCTYTIYNNKLNLINSLNDITIFNILNICSKKKIKEIFNKKLPLVLNRFSNLYNRVCKYILNTCFKYWKQYESTIKKNLHAKLEMDLMNGKINGNYDYYCDISLILKNHIFDRLYHNFNLKINFEDFIENDNYVKKRYDINNKLLIIEKHLEQIVSIKIV